MVRRKYALIRVRSDEGFFISGSAVQVLDINQLLTYEQAARQAGVDPTVVRMWRHRGHLKVATDERGREIRRGRSPLFRLLDVAKAEHATRNSARRNHQ